MWCFCRGRKPSGVDLHALWFWQQWESYKGGEHLFSHLSSAVYAFGQINICLHITNRFQYFFFFLFLFPYAKCGTVTFSFLATQDMSSLMHTIYDVVDASVNHSCHNKSKTLRVKLTVTPEPRCHRREAGTGKIYRSFLWHPFER